VCCSIRPIIVISGHLFRNFVSSCLSRGICEHDLPMNCWNVSSLKECLLPFMVKHTSMNLSYAGILLASQTCIVFFILHLLSTSPFIHGILQASQTCVLCLIMHRLSTTPLIHGILPATNTEFFNRLIRIKLGLE